LTLAECDYGNAYACACAKLSDMYEFAKGVIKDDVKAFKFVNRACKMLFSKSM
jgi:TPR repeat protein